jgi:hypothetical protein
VVIVAPCFIVAAGFGTIADVKGGCPAKVLVVPLHMHQKMQRRTVAIVEFATNALRHDRTLAYLMFL